MPAKKDFKFCFNKKNIGILSLAGLIIILIIGIAFSLNGSIFQAQLDSDLNLEQTTACNSLNLKTIPTPLRANTGAIIIIETEPADLKETITVSASSGSLSGTDEQSGSYINTKEKVLSYSGGEAGSRITAQVVGSANCADSIFIEPKSSENCQNMELTVYPSPLTANQSVEITINTSPASWRGNFFLLSESGKFQLSQKDQTATGENTNTLVTSLKNIIYTGGASGEKITIKALGQGNENCTAIINIE